MSDRKRSAYERWAPTYDAEANPQTALEHPVILAAVAAAAGERLLDAGCGTGRYSGAFAAAGAKVTGLDFSEAMLTRASAAVPTAVFRRADLLQRLPFVDAQFDKLVCAQVLKHLPHLDGPLREFARVLRPDGLLVFSVTHPEMTWDGYEIRQTSTFALSEEADIHHHSWEAYEDALVGAGFEDRMPEAVRVSASIVSFLTPSSFAVVEGRPQVLVCSACRAA